MRDVWQQFKLMKIRDIKETNHQNKIWTPLYLQNNNKLHAYLKVGGEVIAIIDILEWEIIKFLHVMYESIDSSKNLLHVRRTAL